jgi:hypothetical protein
MKGADMKGQFVVLLALVLAGFGLWQMHYSIADEAETNRNFVALYKTAQAARANSDLYALKESNLIESTDEESIESTDKLPAAPTVESTEAAPSPSAGERAAFHYPPYVAIMFIPLTFIASMQTAAITWFCINIAFVLIAAAFATYALSGSFSTGRPGMWLVPMIATAPFVYYFLPTQSLTLFALVIVLAGLMIYRQRLDAIAGLVTSLAVFSPLGLVFGLYYILKRSWAGILGYIVGIAVFVVGLPMIMYHPDRAIEQLKAYQLTVVSPYIADAANTQLLASADNQSVWSVLMRRGAEISYLGESAQKYAATYNVNIPQLTGHWVEVTFVVVGVVLLLGSLLGVTRKLRDRNGLIVGIEGAVVILATLMLAPFTTLADMVVVIAPLFAVVFVIMNTDLKRFVHHVNYVGMVLAIALFYLTFDKDFQVMGCAFVGLFTLWVAVLAGINRFRPHMVAGRGAVTYAAEQKAKADKPIELAKISPHKESIGKHLEEHRQAAGTRQPAKPVPAEPPLGPDAATNVKEPTGLAKLFMHFKSKDLPSLDLGGSDDKKEGDSGKDAKSREKAPEDRKIRLE